MNYFFIAIAFLVAVFMGWIITPQILLVAFRKRLFDSVGGRKTHSGIVPRLGNGLDKSFRNVQNKEQDYA